MNNFCTLNIKKHLDKKANYHTHTTRCKHAWGTEHEYIENAIKAGYELINKALQLYYAMQSPSMPAKDKAIVIAVLGYFILPVDVVPDFIPALGFADDLAALAWALKTISSNITPEVKEKAQQRCDNLFLE